MSEIWVLVGIALIGLIVILPLINLIMMISRRGDMRQLRDRVDSLESQVAALRRRPPAAPPAAGESRTEHAAWVPASADQPTPVLNAGLAKTLATVMADSESPAFPNPTPAPAAPLAPAAVTATPPPLPVAPATTAPPGPSASPSPPPLPPRPMAQPAPASSPVPAPPPPAGHRSGFEENLGSKLFVILGAIALALAGGYLVKYSIDQHWLSDPVKVAAGLLFGSSLVALGLKLREKSNWVAQGCAAAGVFSLYAAVLAGYHSYHLYPQLVCGAFLVLITLAAMVLSLRLGILVALLGLIGGYAVPAMIGGGELRPVALTLYLLTLQGGLLLVAGRMRWTLLALASLAASGLWVALWLGTKFQEGHVLPLGILIVAGVAMHALTQREKNPGEADQAAQPLPAALAMIAGLLLGGGLILVSEFTPTSWLFHGLLAAATLWLARKQTTLRPLPWIALGLTLALLARWGFGERSPAGFGIIAIIFGVLFALGGWLLANRADKPGLWALLAVLAAALHLVLAWRVMGPLENSPLTWGMISVLLAALCVAPLLPIVRRGSKPPWDEAAAAYAAGAAGFVAFAIPLELPRPWIAVGWALLLPALAFIHRRIPIPTLRHAARVLAGLVLFRLGVLVFGMGREAGDNPIVSWLPYGYGLPILSAWAAGRLFTADDEDDDALLQRLLALVLGFIALPLLVRQAFSPGDWFHHEIALAEWALYAILWLGAGWLLGRPSDAEDPLRRRAGLLFALAGLMALILGPCLIANPVFRTEWVGDTPVFNSLLLFYGAPLALIALWWRRLQREESHGLAAVAGTAGLLLLFLLLNLEVRQLFHGGDLHAGFTSHGERLAYSASWALFGLLLLLVALPAKAPRLRHASLVVMLLVSAKVFLFDTSHLIGLYRVLALLALGATLMALAFLYKQFVFKSPSGKE